jgi:hypothetical protein
MALALRPRARQAVAFAACPNAGKNAGLGRECRGYSRESTCATACFQALTPILRLLYTFLMGCSIRLVAEARNGSGILGGRVLADTSGGV